MRTALVVAAAGIAVALGVFGGLWGWDAFKAHRQASAEAAAAAASATEQQSPHHLQQEAVKERLNDAASAQFRNEFATSFDPHIWCGEVNGRNRFGAMVGFTRYIAELKMDEGRVLYSIIDLDSDRDADKFEMKWQAVCRRDTPPAAAKPRP